MSRIAQRQIQCSYEVQACFCTSLLRNVSVRREALRIEEIREELLQLSPMWPREAGLALGLAPEPGIRLLEFIDELSSHSCFGPYPPPYIFDARADALCWTQLLVTAGFVRKAMNFFMRRKPPRIRVLAEEVARRLLPEPDLFLRTFGRVPTREQCEWLQDFLYFCIVDVFDHVNRKQRLCEGCQDIFLFHRRDQRFCGDCQGGKRRSPAESERGKNRVKEWRRLMKERAQEELDLARRFESPRRAALVPAGTRR